MRHVVFSEVQFLAIEANGYASGRNLLMLIEEIQELKDENKRLGDELDRLQETAPEDPIFE